MRTPTSPMILAAIFVSHLAACGAGEPHAAAPLVAAADAMTPPADMGPSPPPDTRPVPDANPTRQLGYACTSHGECTSRLCVSMVCQQRCDLERPNDCGQAGGPCVPTTVPELFFCKGDLKTGQDDDNAILQVGDALRRILIPLDDADLVLVRLNRLGPIVIIAQPVPGIDLALDVYNEHGDKIGAFNNYGPGQAEAAETTAMTITGYVFALVRNVGTSTGEYQLKVIGK